MVQWLRILLPVEVTRVWSLIREDSTCHAAIKAKRYNCWSWYTLESLLTATRKSLHAATNTQHTKTEYNFFKLLKKNSLHRSLYQVSQVSPALWVICLPPKTQWRMASFSVPHISSSYRSDGYSFYSYSKYIHHNWSSAGRAHRPHISFVSSFPR